MSKARILTAFIILISWSITLHAQGSFDLVSVDARNFLGNFKIIPETAEKITDSRGYDNQPRFINNSQMVFSSAQDGDSHDIIMYNFETGRFTNLTRTPDRSEFSPALTDCGQYVSAVTVEEDSSQRLWLYPINMGEPELLYDDIMPIGYYDWHDNIAAMFVLGDPNRLVYPYSKGEVVTLAENIGRSINKRPRTNQVAYLSTSGNSVVDGMKAYELMVFDLKERTSSSLGPALGDSQDFVWVGKNQILMARGNELYLRNVNKSISWDKIATVSLPGYAGISRMAINPKGNKLVLVMEREDNQ